VKYVWTIDALVIVLFIIKSILPMLGIFLLLSGLDDLFVDVAYAARRVWRRYFIYRHHTRLTAQSLSSVPLKNIAIMIPAWAESDVIGAMLKSTTTLWPDDQIHFFIGVYPNDLETTREARHWIERDSRVHLCVVPHAGPTTKADCLNAIWREIKQWEPRLDLNFAAFVLHDCEDLVSAREPHVISHLIDRIDILQFPVRPLILPGSLWVSGHYLDEFSESHGKDLIVREWLGAAMPSAGVGCAFSRRALEYAAGQRAGNPFAAQSLTEDYELAVRLGQAGFRQGFITLAVGPSGRYVATSEYFPGTFNAAVRQKSRWLIGITLQGWDQLRWNGTLADRYMFIRDRKALVTAFLNALALSIFLFLSAISLWQMLDVTAAKFAPLYDPDSSLGLLFLANGYFCLHRLAVRALFVARYHGLFQALLSFPRAGVACVINLAAALRALRLYTFARAQRTPLVWEKTAHIFPGSHGKASGAAP
jgi:bacteriophage N4 adsorption protein B